MNQEWKDLEKEITELIEEHYHLLRLTTYRELDPETEVLMPPPTEPERN